MKKVFITGAEGFTGQYLCRLLQTLELKPLFDHALDIRKYDDCLSVLKRFEPDYVVHLAGISTITHKDPGEIYDVNLKGTLNIIEACLDLHLPISKVILASSAKVYAEPQSEKISETHPLKPATHYAVSKLSMEQMASLYYEKLPIVVVRPFNYTGKGQDQSFFIPKVVSAFQQRCKLLELGNLDLIRDFSHVEFVCQAYAQLLLSDIRSEIFNLCSGTGVSLREIIDRISIISGHRLDVIQKEEFSRANDFYSIVGSNEKLISRLGLKNNYQIDDILKSFFI